MKSVARKCCRSCRGQPAWSGFSLLARACARSPPADPGPNQAERVEASLAEDNPGSNLCANSPRTAAGHAVPATARTHSRFQVANCLFLMAMCSRLLRPSTLRSPCLKQHAQKLGRAVTLLTARPLSNETPRATAGCSSDGRWGCSARIVEHSRCKSPQRTNDLINVCGIYCFNWSRLAAVLPDLEANTRPKGEVYLT